MVKHIILWQFKDELSDEKKTELKAEIKSGLEALKGVVPGLAEIHVRTDCLPSSNADMMLDCTMDDEDALKGYAVHPAHVKIKDDIIAPNVKSRVCIDYKM
ncbi:MAG: Dabb family protein [Lachnospiraceae bacterium]|nr:Dabb family protein [Lachnospiraceae bacterium]MDY4165757.1 Dabb family protein [Lachnospiraceae bacterium]